MGWMFQGVTVEAAARMLDAAVVWWLVDLASKNWREWRHSTGDQAGKSWKKTRFVASLFARKTGKATCIKIRMQNFIVSYIVEVNKCPPKIR
jgi:hypothetical protein